MTFGGVTRSATSGAFMAGHKFGYFQTPEQGGIDRGQRGAALRIARTPRAPGAGHGTVGHALSRGARTHTPDDPPRGQSIGPSVNNEAPLVLNMLIIRSD